MISELFRLITGRPRPDDDADFVEELTVKERRRPSLEVERLILVAWLIIIAKCLLVAWAIERFGIPVHAGWVVVPTLFMAAICTALYYRKD